MSTILFCYFRMHLCVICNDSNDIINCTSLLKVSNYHLFVMHCYDGTEWQSVMHFDPDQSYYQRTCVKSHSISSVLIHIKVECICNCKFYWNRFIRLFYLITSFGNGCFISFDKREKGFFQWYLLSLIAANVGLIC